MIGAGVVGCAIARRFALEGARVIVIEKAADILDGASKGNSGILHTGFDAPVGSLEQRCIAEGYREYLEIRERLDLPILKTGALVLAWSDEQAARLPALIDKAHANGVDDVEPLSAAEILAREPGLSDRVRGGFHVPREYVMDPWTAPYSYLLQAIENGASFLRRAEVLDGAFDGEAWTLETSRGPVKTGTVINAAGLYGDRVDQSLLKTTSYVIRPRKGQFVVFDKAASELLSAILLPVPTEATKGIVICKTSYGNVLVGPTAEEQDSRDDASVDGDTLAALRAHGIEMLPGLAAFDVTATYAGLRPATADKDYQINDDGARRYISVGGIRSTGLSAALGIAMHVFGLYTAFGLRHRPPSDLRWPRVSPISESQERAWSQPGNDGIVCHCELVTRREIEAALCGPLAAASLAALKRRTRVTMGRCQGFYCLGELAEITAGRFDTPLATAYDRRGYDRRT
ncbi:NAD(P)/FAD-dependent oxidoreductase [Pelagibius litoralis]|uniref:NAD(P)/FAD-dependent oxidoreductase n=1 Tax=Pelagibius litoralis TaxID=374515 RepID=A0A967K8G2_9PROT|nr:NAD(P)/FAD-dependent oxidoreductase [Pelagibius litoralis]